MFHGESGESKGGWGVPDLLTLTDASMHPCLFQSASITEKLVEKKEKIYIEFTCYIMYYEEQLPNHIRS